MWCKLLGDVGLCLRTSHVGRLPEIPQSHLGILLQSVSDFEIVPDVVIAARNTIVDQFFCQSDGLFCSIR
ncbi:hypothetical protein BLA6993_01221 [Burkholderia lata]|nr:hypothetical protein BLA6993_01221 [Burkholderia lata]